MLNNEQNPDPPVDGRNEADSSNLVRLRSLPGK